MPRPLTRTANVPHDTINQLKDAFGTIQNAHRKLGLQLDVPFNTFYRAMQFMTIKPHQVDAVMARWEMWRKLHLNPAIPLNDTMCLNPMDFTLEPEWMNGSSMTPLTNGHAPKRKKP